MSKKKSPRRGSGLTGASQFALDEAKVSAVLVTDRHSFNDCPVCHRPVSRLQDSGWEGVWRYCPACTWAGDLCEQTAAFLGLGVFAALKQLREAGAFRGRPPGDWDLYALAERCDQARAVRAAWKEWSASRPASLLLTSEAVSLILERLRLAGLAAALGQNGGPPLGVTTPRTLDALLGGERVSRLPQDWPADRPVLVVGFHDLPGRLAGFWVVGGQAGLADRVYVSVERRPGPGFDAGVGLTKGALPEVPLNSCLYTEPLLALWLWEMHLRDRTRPLNVAAAWWDNKRTSGFSLEWYCNQERVLWALAADPQVVETARRGRTLLTNNPLEERRSLDVIRSGPVDALVRRVAAVAQPVPDEKLALEVSVPDNKVPLGKWLVWEEGDRWLAVAESGKPKRQRVVLDAVVRLDEYFWPGDGDRGGGVYYRGVVRKDGREVPFVEKLYASDDLLVWLRVLCAAHGLGVPSVDPIFAKRLLDVALRLHEPKHVGRAPYKVGWDEERDGFVLPNVTLLRGGKEEAGLVAWRTGLRCLPGDLCFEGLHEAELLYLSQVEDPWVQVGWAVTFWAASCLVADVLGVDPQGCLLVGHAAQEVGTVLGPVLGLGVWDGPAHLPAGANRALEAEDEHRWPLLALPEHRSGRGRPFHPRWFEQRGARRVLAPARLWDWVAGSLHHGWHKIELHFLTHARSSWFEICFRKVLGLWLRHWCRQGLALPSGDSVLDRARKSVLFWFSGLLDAPTIALRLQPPLLAVAPNRQAEALADLLFFAHREGLSDWLAAYVPKSILGRVLTKYGHRPPTAEEVTAWLYRADALLGEPQANAWTFRQEWWEAQRKRWRADRERSVGG